MGVFTAIQTLSHGLGWSDAVLRRLFLGEWRDFHSGESTRLPLLEFIQLSDERLSNGTRKHWWYGITDLPVLLPKISTEIYGIREGLNSGSLTYGDGSRLP